MILKLDNRANVQRPTLYPPALDGVVNGPAWTFIECSQVREIGWSTMPDQPGEQWAGYPFDCYGTLPPEGHVAVGAVLEVLVPGEDGDRHRYLWVNTPEAWLTNDRGKTASRVATGGGATYPIEAQRDGLPQWVQSMTGDALVPKA